MPWSATRRQQLTRREWPVKAQQVRGRQRRGGQITGGEEHPRLPQTANSAVKTAPVDKSLMTPHSRGGE